MHKKLGETERPKCGWCQDVNGKTDISFSIIDDDFGQYVLPSQIKFCPFCGRSLGQRKE